MESEAKLLCIDCFDSLTIDPDLARKEDGGLIELFEGDYLRKVIKKIESV